MERTRTKVVKIREQADRRGESHTDPVHDQYEDGTGRGYCGADPGVGRRRAVISSAAQCPRHGSGGSAERRYGSRISIPLVADIHFDYKLALAAIRHGADKIRINPGNIGSRERVRAVTEAAKERNIPIRVGVNSGSLEKELLEKYGGVTAEGLVESALNQAALIEDMGYDNLVISIKASDVMMCARAHELIALQDRSPASCGDHGGGDTLFRQY